MSLEWDSRKRQANLEKHGYDFGYADLLFNSPHVIGQARTVDNEKRWAAIGVIEGYHVVIVYTRRGDAIRVISMRRAGRNERQAYQAIYGP